MPLRSGLDFNPVEFLLDEVHYFDPNMATNNELMDTLQNLLAQMGNLTMAHGAQQPAAIIENTLATALQKHEDKKVPGPKRHPQSILNLFQPEPFSGEKSEDALEFLETFDQFAQQAKFPVEALPQLLTRFLKGPALAWFKEQDESAMSDMAAITELFSVKYGTPSLSYAEKQIILNRQFKPEEDIECYAYELKKRFTRCGTGPEEQHHIFLKGLPPKLREKILEKGAKTLGDAIIEARRLHQIQKMAQGYDTDALTVLQGLTNSITKINEQKAVPSEDALLHKVLKDLMTPAASKTRPVNGVPPQKQTHGVRKVTRPRRKIMATTATPIRPTPAITCNVCKSTAHQHTECLVLRQMVQEAAGNNKPPRSRPQPAYRSYRPTGQYNRDTGAQRGGTRYNARYMRPGQASHTDNKTLYSRGPYYAPRGRGSPTGPSPRH